MQKIFISYSSNDRDIAQKLAENLEDNGFGVWIDQKGITGGTSWAASILEALNNCDILLALHSQSSLNSYQCKGEWFHAFDMRKRIIPILLTSNIKIHPFLSHLHYLNFSDFTQGFAKLIVALNTGEVPVQKEEYKLYKTGEPVFYPNFFNQDAAAYTPYVMDSKLIRYCGSSGHMFFDMSHESGLMNMANNNGQVKALLVKPTRDNIKQIAYKSPWTQVSNFDDTVQRFVGVYRETLKTINRLNAQFEDCVEVGLLQYAPPVPQVQFDPSSENGVISVGIYAFGASDSTPIFRPGTMLRYAEFPELYRHFRLMFDNMWEVAEKQISIENLLTDLDNL